MAKSILLLAIIFRLFSAMAEQYETINGLDWYYEINSAGTGASLIRVSGINKESIVTLPSGVGAYGRIPIVSIASNFYWNTSGGLSTLSYPRDRIEYLIIPESVRDIGISAFRGSYMPRVNLGGTTNIADYAFFGSSLGSVSFGSALLRVGYRAFSVSKVESINFDYHAPLSLASQAFMNCEHLKSLTLPYALKFDGGECFSGCTALESVSTVYGLKAIGRGAFKGCSRLKSVSITGSVGEIASEAFSGCAVLTSVQFGTFGVVTTNIASSAFSGCSNLQDIDIPSAVENIGSDAFCDCLHLTNVVLRAGLKNIGVRAFSGCNSLSSIYIPSTVETIGAHAFVEQYSTLAGWQYRCHLKTVYCDPGDQDRVKNLIVDATAGATVPVVPFRKYATIDGITWAYVPSFDGCEISEQFTTPAISTDAVGEVVVPMAIDGRSVSAIGDYAFNGCKNITSLILPNGVETIGQHAFSGCAELSILTLPCVMSIALTAFEGCNNLAEIRITTPCNLREFKNAIAKCGLDCSRIKFVVLNHSIDDQVAISYLSYHGEVTIQGFGDVNVSAVPPDVCGALDIPAELSGEPVVEIGDFAFYGCSNLTSVSMPTSVRRIGDKAFYGCGSIDEFKMPNQDVSIGRQAFEFTGLWNSSPEGCVVIDGIFVGIKGDSVDEIMIPNGVARINDAALFSCSNIVTIGMPDSICGIQSNAFVDCSKWTVVKVSYEHADRILGLVRASGQNTELLSVVYTTLPPPIITPADGSIFDLKTKVVISNIVTDATIYYTTDGSDPTVNSRVYSKFNATSKITIKAIAVLNGYLSPVATATIAPGKVAAPVLSSDCEGVFVGQTKVTMTCATADAEIYYTLDGSVPTRDAARYSGEIILNDSCMVRAIAVNSEWLDSDEESLILRRKSSAPTIIAESEFMGCEERVRIVSPDVGAKIYYTIDGTAPTVENGILYEEEFTVDSSVMVRAIAVTENSVPSEAVAFEIRQLTPASGEGNWIKSFDVEYDKCWSKSFYINYEVGGNPSANSVTGYLYVVYKGVTNRLHSVGLNAGAGRYGLKWNPETDKFNFERGDVIGFIARICDKDLTAPKRDFDTGWEREPGKDFDGLPVWSNVQTLASASRPGWVSGNFVVEAQQAGPISLYAQTLNCGAWYSLVFSMRDTRQTFYYPTKDVYSHVASIAAGDAYGVGWEMRTSQQLDYSAGNYKVAFGGEVDFFNNVVQLGRISKHGDFTVDAEVLPNPMVLTVGDVVTLPCFPSILNASEVALVVDGGEVGRFTELGHYEFVRMVPKQYEVRLVSSNRSTEPLIIDVRGPVITVIGDDVMHFTYSHKVELQADMAGARIFYTLDGRDPLEDGLEYIEPIVLTKSTTLKAVALLPNGGRGEMVVRDFMRDATISDSLNAPDLVCEEDEFSAWEEDCSVACCECVAVRSGKIKDREETRLSAFFSVKQKGEVSFWWKASCEDDPDFDDWDYGVFKLNGEEIARIDGETDWDKFTMELSAGEYTAEWIYHKDDEGSDGADCIWIADVSAGDYATVIFDDGNVVITNQSVVGKRPILPPDPFREGYEFLGWDGDVGAAVLEDVIFKAKWRRIVCHVEFDLGTQGERIGGGDLIQDVYWGGCVIPPLVKSQEGWSFSGWSSDLNQPIVSNTVICALFERTEYFGVMGDIAWRIRLADGRLTLTGSGDIPDFQKGSTDGWRAYCGEIKEVVVAEAIHCIGDRAFSGCTNLVSVDIPKTVLKIGSYAFEDCKSLASVDIPISVTSIGYYAFKGCTSLIRASIPFVGASQDVDAGAEAMGSYVFGSAPSVKFIELKAGERIPTSAFNGFGSLQGIILPQSLKNIGNQSFSSCYNLMSVDIPNGVTNIGDSAFYNCYKLPRMDLPEGLRSLGARCFQSCSSLKQLYLPGKVESIGSLAFGSTRIEYIDVSEENEFFVWEGGYLLSYDRKRLVFCPSHMCLVTFPPTVSQICGGAFYGCTNISEIVIPEHVEVLGESAFESCYRLKKVEIRNCKEIPAYAFSGCSRLEHVILSNAVAKVMPAAFHYCNSLRNLTCPSSVRVGVGITQTDYQGKLVENSGIVTNVVINDNSTTICYNAFLNFSGLKSVHIPDSITSIEINAFFGCLSLKHIDWPDALEQIGEGAFACTGLEGILIMPMSVKKIVGDAFRKNVNLRTLVLPSRVALGNSAFLDCSGLESISILDFGTTIGTKTFVGCPSVLNLTYPATWAVKTLLPDSYDKITNVTILAGVTSLGGQTFNGCTRLMSVWLPDSVNTIGSWAFEGCGSLRNVRFGSSLRKISSGAFRECGLGPELWLPQGLELIDTCAFQSCAKLEFVSVPSTVKTIDYAAFQYCDALKIAWLHSKKTSYVYGSSFPSACKVMYDYNVAIPVEENKSLIIDGAWLNNLVEQNPSFAVGISDYISLAFQKTGKHTHNGEDVLLWQEFVAGTDPMDPKSIFKATIKLVDGKPVVTWEPELPADEAAKRVYTTYGKKSLVDKEWSPTTEETMDQYQFFKVGVDMRQ